MKLLMIEGVRGPQLQEVDIPAITSHQVLVKNQHSLISTGTERHYLKQCIDQNKKLRPGYCGVGEVVELGDSVKHLKVGQKVIAMGWNYAIHAEYIAMPQRLVQPVPSGMPLSQALFANIMATAVHAVDRAKLSPDDKILIVGAGLVGHMVADIAKLTVSSVLLTDLDESKATLNPNIDGISSEKLEANIKHFKSAFSKVFVCISGRADSWFDIFPTLLNKRGNGQDRPAIIGVGRYSANINFSVELGNIDMFFSARCGEGYRNEAYMHGVTDLIALPGEHTVDDNLLYSLEVLLHGQVQFEHLISKRLKLCDLPKFYSELKVNRHMLSAIVDYN